MTYVREDVNRKQVREDYNRKTWSEKTEIARKGEYE